MTDIRSVPIFSGDIGALKDEMSEGLPLQYIGMGTLILMDWMESIDGHNIKGFYGNVFVGKDEAVVGFTATGHNTANWVARVEGPTEALTVMGCQVRAFFEGGLPHHHSHYQVLT